MYNCSLLRYFSCAHVLKLYTLAGVVKGNFYGTAENGV